MSPTFIAINKTSAGEYELGAGKRALSKSYGGGYMNYEENENIKPNEKGKKMGRDSRDCNIDGLERVFSGLKALWHPSRLTVKILTKIVTEKKDDEH